MTTRAISVDLILDAFLFFSLLQFSESCKDVSSLFIKEVKEKVIHQTLIQGREPQGVHETWDSFASFPSRDLSRRGMTNDIGDFSLSHAAVLAVQPQPVFDLEYFRHFALQRNDKLPEHGRENIIQGVVWQRLH